MASDSVPSLFLSCPNEIIRTVFDHLSIMDLLQSFGDIRNQRLQNLLRIQTATMKLDVSDSSLEWFLEHLSIVQQYVKRISVDVNLLESLLQFMPVLDTLNIYFQEDEQFIVDHYITELQRVEGVRIGALTLSTFDGAISSRTTQLLLQGNGRFPEHTLNIDSCLFHINARNLPISQLRHVNFLVKEEKILHILCAHLPQLETIQIAFLSSGLQMQTNFFHNLQVVDIVSEGVIDEDASKVHILYPKYEATAETNEITIVAPVHLRSITINGHLATFTRLSRLFTLASASLKTIRMKASAYSIIDPKEIDAVAPHIDFQFKIDYRMIGTPANFDWQQYLDEFIQHPTICCESLVFCNLSSVIDRSMFWLTTKNIFVSSPFNVYFPRVKIVKFEFAHVTINSETVELIQQAFPNAHILKWRLSLPKVSTKRTLDKINVLDLYSAEGETLASLLVLCPNVKQIRFTSTFETIENLSQLDDAHIQNTCKQIESIRLVPSEQFVEQEIQELFPNARITYDATPYRVRMF